MNLFLIKNINLTGRYFNHDAEKANIILGGHVSKETNRSKWAGVDLKSRYVFFFHFTPCVRTAYISKAFKKHLNNDNEYSINAVPLILL